jgi:hypothetical protein
LDANKLKDSPNGTALYAAFVFPKFIRPSTGCDQNSLISALLMKSDGAIIAGRNILMDGGATAFYYTLLPIYSLCRQLHEGRLRYGSARSQFIFHEIDKRRAL